MLTRLLSVAAGACMALSITFGGMNTAHAAVDFCINPGFEDGEGDVAEPWSKWGGVGGAIENPSIDENNPSPRSWYNFDSYVNVASQNAGDLRPKTGMWFVPGGTYHFTGQVYVPAAGVPAGLEPRLAYILSMGGMNDQPTYVHALNKFYEEDGVPVVNPVPSTISPDEYDTWVTREFDWTFEQPLPQSCNYPSFRMYGGDGVGVPGPHPDVYFDNLQITAMDYRGDLFGFVKDSLGNPVEGAEVVLRSPFIDYDSMTPEQLEAHQSMDVVISEADGSYAMPTWAPHGYEFTADATLGDITSTAAQSLMVTEAASQIPDIILSVDLPTLTWQGGTGLWDDPATDNWTDGSTPDLAPAATHAMIIDAIDDGNGGFTASHVTVAADFVDDNGTGPGTGDGPAGTVTVGQEGDENNGAKLTIAAGATLEVLGGTAASEFGKIAVENGATLQTGSATIELDAKWIAGVQGPAAPENCGLIKSDGQLTIEESENAGTIYGGADALNVDWLPGEDVGSMFGGVYRVAEYSGDTLAPGGTMTNSEGNIGTGYIKSVAYDVDVNGDGTVYGVEVELHAQGNGDTDLDADVDGDDLATFGLAWAPSGTDKTWFDGDFDFDGDIDGDDLAALGLAWAPSGISFPAGDVEVTAVPEPGTIVMLLVAAAGLLIYRKRR